jgi:hypothetical protein
VGRVPATSISGDFSWRRSADGYGRLYADAREKVAGGRVINLQTVRAGE